MHTARSYMGQYGRGEVDNRLFQSVTIIIMIITIIIDKKNEYMQRMMSLAVKLVLRSLDL
jgi:hypothetical protein